MSKTKKWTVHEKRPQEPKWFTHNGYINTDPTKIKKNGAGKNNWGQDGDESDFILFNKKSTSRRNSNHDVNELKLMQLNNSIDAKFG
ncbi:Stf2 protein [Candida orthopsilosis Co 90-125]|uniref:Stf2 protein n=1 Tax=Candida orthopsilosis (strain 90-125) TaxID=1136231 RepID=H8WZ37_CANO9|nr:Stf2 protein [Candida orthopsilosis Co 90-125]CCG21669.1 Stf2 protein [Candida orthopsilosis Co 90-125]